MRQKEIKRKVVLAVGAHPDDIDFAAAGTIAKWLKEGVTAYYLICTNGNKGSDKAKTTPEKLAKIRRKEQEKAAEVLGVKKVFFLNHNDGELEPSLELKKEIVKVIRTVKPQTVITMDPTARYSEKRGYINHPDHIAAGEATLAAVFPLSRDRLNFPEHEKQGLALHKVLEVLMNNFDEPNFYVDISSTIDLKFKALKEHKSQFGDFVQLEKVLREWAKAAGRKAKSASGGKYAEGFKRVVLGF